MTSSTNRKGRWSLLARVALTIAVATCSLGRSPTAQADPLFKAATTMVYGTSTDTYSITAPGEGTITAAVFSVPWLTPLSALSFNLTDASNIINPVTQPTAQAVAPAEPAHNQPQIQTYQVGPGTYFAHVSATAGGALNWGVYSAMFTFTPSAVPLPATVGMLLIGLLVVIGLLRATVGDASQRNESVMSAA